MSRHYFRAWAIAVAVWLVTWLAVLADPRAPRWPGDAACAVVWLVVALGVPRTRWVFLTGALLFSLLAVVAWGAA